MNLGNFSGIYGLAATPALVFTPIVAAETNIISNIINIQSLDEIKVCHPEKTLFLFDLDDTIFDFPNMLGSRAWRRYIGPATKKIDDSRNWHDVLSHFLTKNYPVKTVEPMTSEFVKNIQEKGYVTCGFTSRERKLWYDTPQEGVDAMTIDQLHSVGINFNNHSFEKTFPYLKREKGSEYFNGTFFCNIEPKGNFLTHLFNDALKLPSKVVFIDDKLSQVESVSNSLTALGIQHEGYCYLATNAKAEAFNPLIANIQLHHFCKSRKILSDDEAALIANENPENTAEFYLRAVLDIAKDF